MGRRFKKPARDKSWKCPKCKHGYMQRDESLDEPFGKDMFNGEGEWQGYKCDRCGYVELEPFD